MSKTPLVLIAGLLAATFACAPASAQTNPFGAAKAKPHQAGAAVKTETPEPARVVDRVAFSAGPNRECAMLTCPTFVLTGVGD